MENTVNRKHLFIGLHIVACRLISSLLKIRASGTFLCSDPLGERHQVGGSLLFLHYCRTSELIYPRIIGTTEAVELG